MPTWFKTRAASEQQVQVDIYDYIGYYGVTSVDFRRDVRSALQRGAAELRVNIHSPGGSVFEALAIFNFLNSLAIHVETRVEGVAASAASLIAMAGRKRTMAESAYLMLHEPSLSIDGRADDLRDAADFLEKIRDSMIAIYVNSSGGKLSTEWAAELLDAETWLTASESIDMGLTDEVVLPLRAVAQLDLTAFKHVPANIVSKSETKELIMPKTEMTAADVRAEVREIAELCAIAGRSELAAEYICNGVSAADARAKLAKLGPKQVQAAATGEEIVTAIPAGRSAAAENPLDVAKIYARWNKRRAV